MIVGGRGENGGLQGEHDGDEDERAHVDPP
jgi:hypothetical protein